MSGSITCGHCKETHFTVEAVRRCYAGTGHPCGWQYYERDRWGYVHDEDGQRIIRECRALAWENDRGSSCEAGHEHVLAEQRDNEGWDYVDGPEEARRLARLGVASVGMDGSSVLY